MRGQQGQQAFYGVTNGLIGCFCFLTEIHAHPVLPEESVGKRLESFIDLAKLSKPCTSMTQKSVDSMRCWEWTGGRQ